MIRFLSGISNARKQFVNVPNDPGIISLEENEWYHIPIRQRNHWNKYRVKA